MNLQYKKGVLELCVLSLTMYYLLPVLLLGTVWLFCRWNRHPRKRTFVLQTA